MSEPIRTLHLGDVARRESREETFLDGKLRVRSRDGLKPSERAILAVLPHDRTGRALVLNSTHGVLGHALRVLNPKMEVVCHFHDMWNHDQAARLLERTPDDQLSLNVAADPPAGPWQIIVAPFEQQGVTDLVREEIRMAASEWLAPQGLLYTSSDRRGERFVRDEVKKAFGALHTAPEERGRNAAVAYVARKPAKILVRPPGTETSFEVEADCRHLTFSSRAGVFCSDRLDPGTRALLALARVNGAKRILDLGCGSGVVGIITALQELDAEIVMLDSNARAMVAAKKNAEEHGVSGRCKFVLSADPVRDLAGHGPFDLVLTNPPYYGNLRIAEMFVEAAKEHVTSGGRLQLVTKDLPWYLERLGPEFLDIREEKRGGYSVVSATHR